MSFRRSKNAVVEAKAWRKFREVNAAILQASGVPASIFEPRELFDDLLMHGYIDHHEDPTHFYVGQLTSSQRETLIEVAACYLRAGFPDPGIGGFMGGQVGQEIRRRAGLTA
jgi:hypothetical protein